MSHEKETFGTKNKIVIISACLAILCLIIFTGWHFLHGSFSADAPSAASTGIVYDDAAIEGGWESLSQEEIEANLNRQVEEGYINISMNASPVFENGQAEGNLMIVNETVNRYPQQVVITRNDNGETIYTSAAIPVGSKIAADTLDMDLEAGAYDCTAMFHSLDPDSGAILGSAGANITITVQN